MVIKRKPLLKNSANNLRINKAWIARWCPVGDRAVSLIKKLAPQGEIVDILNSRKNFDYIFKHAKNIYKLSTLSLSEKLPFAHYTKGEKYSKDFFSRVPIFTHYQSAWYRALQKKELENPCSAVMREKWKDGLEKHSQYVTVGHNPYLEIKEVFNLTRKESKNSKAIFTWDEIIGDGTIRNITYKI